MVFIKETCRFFDGTAEVQEKMVAIEDIVKCECVAAREKSEDTNPQVYKLTEACKQFHHAAEFVVDRDSPEATHDSMAFVFPGPGKAFSFLDPTVLHRALVDGNGVMGVVELKTPIYRFFIHMKFTWGSVESDLDMRLFWRKCEERLKGNNWHFFRNALGNLFDMGGDQVQIHAAVATVGETTEYQLYTNTLIPNDGMTGDCISQYLLKLLAEEMGRPFPTQANIRELVKNGEVNTYRFFDIGGRFMPTYSKRAGLRMILTALQNDSAHKEACTDSIFLPTNIEGTEYTYPFSECFERFSIRASNGEKETPPTPLLTNLMNPRKRRRETTSKIDGSTTKRVCVDRRQFENFIKYECEVDAGCVVDVPFLHARYTECTKNVFSEKHFAALLMKHKSVTHSRKRDKGIRKIVVYGLKYVYACPEGEKDCDDDDCDDGEEESDDDDWDDVDEENMKINMQKAAMGFW
jgi:hypothetical protein